MVPSGWRGNPGFSVVRVPARLVDVDHSCRVLVMDRGDESGDVGRARRFVDAHLITDQIFRAPRILGKYRLDTCDRLSRGV